MKHIYILFFVAVAFAFTGCAGGKNDKKNQTTESAHNHEGHDHSAHKDHDDHEGHDHEGHDHIGDAHEGHQHSASCSHGDPHDGHDHEPPTTEDSHDEGEIVFTPEQAAMIDFAVEMITPGEFSEVTRCSGQIMAAQGGEAVVSAKVSGIVSYANLKLSEGTKVASGQPLFYIATAGLAGGDAAVRSAAAFNKARSDMERAEQLLPDSLISVREYQATKLAYQEALAEYEPYRSAGAKGGAASSAIGGYVTSLDVAEGEFVEVGQRLATISQNNRLRLRAEVSQKYYDRLPAIRTATFRTVYNKKSYPLAEMNGRLLSSGMSAAAGGHMVPVVFEFDNRQGVVAGSFVEVFLLGTKHENVLSVPLSAVTEEQGLHYVYIQRDKEHYERRAVQIGANDGVRVAVASGMKAGERVVTRGAVNVKMAGASGEIPHGHTH